MSRLKAALDAGQFVVTSELTPPKGTDLTDLFAKADALSGSVTAFNVTDCHGARMSLCPLAAAHLLIDRGVEPILQMTTRDRNRLALQSDMLGASALGVENVVFMGGDPPKVGDHPEAKPVFDVYSSQILDAARRLTEGEDMMGNALNAPADLFIGAVVNPGADDLDEEIARMAEKRDAGARFFQSQAVFEPERFERFVRAAEQVDAPVLAGIIPLKSSRMARYMHDRVPGIRIPDAIFAELDGAPDLEAAAIDIAARTIRAVRGLSRGVHVMAIGWESRVPAILRAGGLA